MRIVSNAAATSQSTPIALFLFCPPRLRPEMTSQPPCLVFRILNTFFFSSMWISSNKRENLGRILGLPRLLQVTPTALIWCPWLLIPFTLPNPLHWRKISLTHSKYPFFFHLPGNQGLGIHGVLICVVVTQVYTYVKIYWVGYLRWVPFIQFTICVLPIN